MPKKEKFADRVRTLRDERTLTQTQLAKAAGLSAAFLSRLMKGEREMTFEYVVALASALKVTVGELVAGTTAEGITTKWVEYEKFDEAERGRLAALQELDVLRREVELLREGVAKLAAAEHAARELPLVRQTLTETQTTLRHCSAERDSLRVKHQALTTALETCNTHRITLQRMLEDAGRQVLAVRQEASNAKSGAAIVSGLAVLGGVLGGVLMAENGSSGKKRR